MVSLDWTVRQIIVVDVVTTNDDGCLNSPAYYVSIVRQKNDVTEKYSFDKGKLIIRRATK